MYNILINNLSLVNSGKKNIYVLNTTETSNESKNFWTFHGIYTNEPVTWVLLRKFANEEKGEKLDEILSLTSKKVKTTIFDGSIDSLNDRTRSLLNSVKAYLNFSEDAVMKLTHYDFYEETINKMVADEFLLETDEEICSMKPKLDSVDIPNIPEAADIHEAVIRLAEKIIQLYNNHPEGCRLFMDYTGGDRSTSTIIIALTKMLEVRDIHVDQIWAVNFDRDAKIQEIREKIEVNYIFDFISGIHEFNNYGRAQILNEFFRKSIDKKSIIMSSQAEILQGKIQNVADQIQMCRSSKMVSSIGELVNAIKNYEKNDTVHEPIFDYLISDIKNNYVNIYSNQQRTVLNIIRWCLEKNLIQQAVTMYAELIPQELVNQKILYYGTADWNQKTQINSYTYIYDNEVRNYWENGTVDCQWIQKEYKPYSRKYQAYSVEYAYISYYIGLEICARSGCSSQMSGKQKAELIADYIMSTPSPNTQYKKGMSKKQLANILNNYWQFKKLIRHFLNHASPRPLDIGKIRKDMHWTNEEKIFLDSSNRQIGHMTVKTLTDILYDLLIQLEDTGMK